MRCDFNGLERRAQELVDAGRYKDAIRIFLFMGDGDPSLDGGYLGERLGQCYEAVGELAAAKYWYGRAVEENPSVCERSAEALVRLKDIVNLDDILPRDDYVVDDWPPETVKARLRESTLVGLRKAVAQLAEEQAKKTGSE